MRLARRQLYAVVTIEIRRSPPHAGQRIAQASHTRVFVYVAAGRTEPLEGQRRYARAPPDYRDAKAPTDTNEPLHTGRPAELTFAQQSGRAVVEGGPGVLLAIGIAGLVHLALRSDPVVPEVVAALAVGVAVRNVGGAPWSIPGAKLVVRYGLRLAIIALGAGLDLGVVSGRGVATLLLIVILVSAAMSLGLILGHLAGLQRRVSILLGVGTAICGASAILAVSPLIRAREQETAYAVTTIFVFNVVALLCLPLIGHQFGISQLRFGTWVGTAVNDTSVVLATGYLYGPTAGGVAAVVKLTRTILLIPLSIIVGLRYGGSSDTSSVYRRAKENIPWFVLGFFLLAILNTAHIAPAALTRSIAQGGAMLLVVVLAAVGLGVDVQNIRRMGIKPLVIGFILAAAMALISIMLIVAFDIE